MPDAHNGTPNAIHQPNPSATRTCREEGCSINNGLDRGCGVDNGLDRGCGVGNGLDRECGAGDGLDRELVDIVVDDDDDKMPTHDVLQFQALLLLQAMPR